MRGDAAENAAEDSGEDAAGDVKRAVRSEVASRLRGMGSEDKDAQASEVARHVLGLPEVRGASRVAVFLSSARLHEVDTAPIIRGLAASGSTTLYAPRLAGGRESRAMSMLELDLAVDGRDADAGTLNRHGVAEPHAGRPDALDAPGPLDLCLVPGVAFDARGGRVGRGGGYYDRWIASYAAICAARGWRPPLLAALAYECQILLPSSGHVVPQLPHDIPMDLVVAPSGVIRTRREAHAAVSHGATGKERPI